MTTRRNARAHIRRLLAVALAFMLALGACSTTTSDLAVEGAESSSDEGGEASGSGAEPSADESDPSDESDRPDGEIVSELVYRGDELGSGWVPMPREEEDDDDENDVLLRGLAATEPSCAGVVEAGLLEPDDENGGVLPDADIREDGPTWEGPNNEELEVSARVWSDVAIPSEGFDILREAGYATCLDVLYPSLLGETLAANPDVTVLDISVEEFTVSDPAIDDGYGLSIAVQFMVGNEEATVTVEFAAVRRGRFVVFTEFQRFDDALTSSGDLVPLMAERIESIFGPNGG